MQILLVDTDTSSAGILEVGLRKSLPADIIINHASGVPPQVDSGKYDVAIVNHNLYDDSFSKCFLLKQRNPALQTVVITSPGDSLRHLKSLQASTGMIDEVVEKPVHFQLLARSLEALQQRLPGLKKDVPSLNLERYLPTSLSVDELHAARAGDAILTEKTILFADIRRSTELLRQSNLDEFFVRLNRHFAAIAGIVERNRGEVIKYTGDGVLALFSGFARRYLGFRCAREILQNKAGFDADFSMGLGLTDGLVMLGFIGSEQRVFYDVIGSNVNMAARFCAEAGANELLMSDTVMRASGLDAAAFNARTLKVKGIGQAVRCFHYSPQENPV